MEEKDLDVVLLMKKVHYKDVVGYRPVECTTGYYEEEDGCFYDLEGTPYYHIIEEPETMGFCDRESLEELRNCYIEDNLDGEENNLDEVDDFFDMDIDIENREVYWREIDEKIMDKKLEEALLNYYCYFDEISNDFNVPVILYREKESHKKAELFLDGDIVSFYYDCYGEFFNKYFKIEKNEEENKISAVMCDNTNNNKKIKEIKKQINISKMFKEITKTVIDQDNPIRKILTAVWKQLDDFSEEKSRNILINGGTGVGKTEIFRILTKLIDVPCVMTSATQYSGTGYVGGNVEDMLVSLLKRTNGDLKKAEKGILIIDEVDKLAETNSGHSQVNQKDVQESLLKILEDGILTIEYNQRLYEFDTSKLMVVAMGSWSRVKIDDKKTIGFSNKDEKNDKPKKTYKDITREDMVKNGMLPDFIGRFNTIIQMNDLNYESFLRILKSKNNITTLNRKFLAKKGVRLTIKKDAYEAIAEKASKSKFGARGLDEIVEEALSAAVFEIATHPNKYSSLIINKDTILNNENYKLIKKKKD